ncbi:MAG: HRDC domain-containing protein, partial [Phycisphaerae bacterium]|nr:HRDC domain-containing protein [Phycisphaerae bacterium]
DIVTGANTKKIRSLGHDRIKTYGVGKEKDKRFWRGIIDDLISQKCLIQTEGQYPVLQVTPHGREVLFGRQEFYVLKRPEPQGRGRSAVTDDYDRELFERLRSVRTRLAGEQNVPPYVVFSDRTLHEMACYFPVTPDEMRRITGVGDMKLQRYGDEFLPPIQAFVESNPQAKSDAAPLPTPRAPGLAKSTRTKTFDTTWQLLKEGLDRSQIAERRGLTTGTISTHIERLILDGRDVELDRQVDSARRLEIERLFKRLGMDSLREIVEASDGMVGYEEARIVRAAIQVKSDRK